MGKPKSKIKRLKKLHDRLNRYENNKEEQNKILLQIQTLEKTNIR